MECFFGRLKCLWSIFSFKWTVDEKFFEGSSTWPALSQTSTSFTALFAMKTETATLACST